MSYTGVYNILDLSATSFPTGVVADKEKDIYPQDFTPHGEGDEQVFKDYDASDVHAMPVSLQLVGKRLEEEKTIAVTERVVEVLGGV